MLNIETDAQIPQEFRAKDPQWWVDMMLSDLFFLCKVVLHHGKKKECRDLNWTHRRLCDFLDMKKNPIPQKLVLMFRDALKSTIARGKLLQWVLRKCHNKDLGKAFMFSGIVDLAEDHVDRVWKELVSNQLIQAFFYNVLPHKKSDFEMCSKDGLRYKGVEVDVGSPEKSLTGHHYELGLIDNLVNEVNSQHAESRAKIFKRWQQLESVLIEDAEEVLFETTWWPDDLSGTILDPEGQNFDYRKIRRKPCLEFISDMGYSVFSCPARDEAGDPVFPEKTDNKYLERKRKKQGRYLYNALYELQPIVEENMVFIPSWIIHCYELPKNYVRNLVIDCAGTTKKESTHTAMSIGDWDETGKLHIPYAYKKKLNPVAVKEWAIELIDKAKEEGRPITYVGIEKEKYGIFLADVLKMEDIEPYIVLLDIKNIPQSKRLSELVSKYETGTIVSRLGLKDYEDEVKTYYRGKEKGTDILNTIYYHFRIKILPPKIKQPEFVPVIAPDFARQIKRERERVGESARQIAARF